MNDGNNQENPRRGLIRHDLKKRSVRSWVVPLLVVVALIFFLPRLVALLEK